MFVFLELRLQFTKRNGLRSSKELNLKLTEKDFGSVKQPPDLNQNS